MKIKLILAAVVAVATSGIMRADADPTNLRVHSVLVEDSDFFIDNQLVQHMIAGSVNFVLVTAGAHHFEVKADSGGDITLDATLDESQMSSARGRSWWCMVTGRASGGAQELRLILSTPQQCAGLLDAAPEDDVPPGD